MILEKKTPISLSCRLIIIFSKQPSKSFLTMEVDDAPGGGDGAGSSPKPGGDDAAAAQQQSTEAVLSNCLERFA